MNEYMLLTIMLSGSVGLYITIVLMSFTRFHIVGYHNGLFAFFMMIMLVGNVLELISTNTSFHVVCFGVAMYTMYNMRERLRHV